MKKARKTGPIFYLEVERIELVQRLQYIPYLIDFQRALK